MKTKALLLGAAIATAVSACATTTSPTGRTQYVGAVSQEQLNQLGEQPFLHAWKMNVAAIRLYESLGFEIRTEVQVAVLERPAQPG